jgi:hypothetical protein
LNIDKNGNGSGSRSHSSSWGEETFVGNRKAGKEGGSLTPAESGKRRDSRDT